MGPAIILDKSAMQALSFKELIFLRRHFNVVLAPVIAMEILADLKKEERDRPPEEVVMTLADKLMPSQSTITTHYSSLLEGNLLGYEVQMSNRPIIGQGRRVVDDEGKTGYVRDVTEAETAIERWRAGQFTAAEEALAERWRAVANRRQLESLQNALADRLASTISPTSPTELRDSVIALIDTDSRGNDLLQLAILLGKVSPDVASQIWYRWETQPDASLERFAPYAYYFMVANYTFWVGLAAKLVTTRPTNVIDLEYLYYLPFCEVFCSNDKFHKTMAPALLSEKQLFIDGEELKADLRRLAQDWKRLSEEQQDQHLKKWGYQPTDDQCFVYSIWKQCWPGWNPRKIDPLRFNEAETKEILDRVIRQQGAAEDLSPRDGESDFLILTRQMKLSDPCFCGSTRAFGDCHGSVLKGS